ncbi:outer membrane beta-barrel protein [Hymenobacter lucidus]|uniref:PorT family protein n=1 Tax=Hymenobacter lucidus TaxID=2880930 RepID=A0ABS8ALC4_9BACT|nr:outer membrane beta-barrel protein [Hymenobacter lucidus]MCB2406843.1 PorT family protein [Hymenobacter lucidus]
MKKSVLFIGLLFSSSAAFAQANFRPGYILPLTGDTVRGSIDYQGELRNSLLCRFRPTAEAAVVEYQPAQLRGYGFSTGRDLQSRQLPGTAAKQAFLQTLVLGKASLYHSINDKDKDLYYAGAGTTGPLEALIQQDSTQSGNDAQRYTTLQQVRTYPFRNVLWKLMADCPSVQAKLVRLELKEAALIKTFEAYNACGADGKPQYVVKKQTSKLRFAALGGMQQSSLTYVNKGDHQVKSSLQPVLGIGLALQPGRFNPRLSLQVQALYLQQTFNDKIQTLGDGLYANEYVTREINVSITSVRVPAMLRYTFLTTGIQPYLQGGGAFSINVNGEGTRRTTGSRFNVDETQKVELRPTNMSVLAGVGVAKDMGPGRLSLEVRVDFLDGTSSVASGENRLSGSRNIALLAGYTFGR